MSDIDQTSTNEPAAGEEKEPRKVSLAEAVKRKLAQKKQEQAGGGKQQKHEAIGNQPKMKSQNTKKINNQRKRMGV
ncbi:hypothetical protein AB6A23_07355 [Paenibacillus tarimensis]